MSEKTTTDATQEGEGLKIRKKPQQEQEVTSTESAQADVVEQAPEQEVQAEEKAPALHRRVVDPKAAPKASAPRKEEAPATSFESGTTEDFAALFESAGDQALPSRRHYNKGDKVTGPVTLIDSRYIYVDLGGRGEARAAREQYEDEEGNLTLEVGQDHEFIVIGFSGGIELGNRLEARSNGLEALEEAEATGLPLMGRVTAKNKGGFTVEIAKVEAFCPVSQIDLHNADELDVYVGQTFNFKVMEIRENGRNVVVSRAAYLRDQQEEARKETMEKLEIGAVLQGTVRSISDFGAFVNLGGVDGLVHISEMSWGSVDKPSDVVSDGQTVDVKVLSVEDRGGRNGLRISLSMKQVHEDPWNSINERFHVGMQVDGVVVRTAAFGAFVEIAPGIDGLVHVSELSWEHVRRTDDVVKVGDKVKVEILDIDVTRQRIGLSMKNVSGDPWDKVVDDFPIGSEVTGFVEKVEDFGAFVNLGQVTALLPRSEMQLSNNETPHARFKPGSEVTARVLNVEPDRRRMALTLKEEVDAEAAAAATAKRSGRSNTGRSGKSSSQGPRSYSDTSGGSFGTLGDLLKLRNDK